MRELPKLSSSRMDGTLAMSPLQVCSASQVWTLKKGTTLFLVTYWTLNFNCLFSTGDLKLEFLKIF